MIFHNSPGPNPISLGSVRNGPYKYYNFVPYYIPISDIMSIGEDDWVLVLTESARVQHLQGYGYSEQEAYSTSLDKNISQLDDTWFRDNFGEDYQNKNIFLYFA